MANVLKFDLTTGRVLDYLRSVHTPHYEGRDDHLINPVLPENFGTVPARFFKVVSGAVQEMSPAEKQAILDAETSGQLASLKAAAKDVVNLRNDEHARILKAFLEVMRSEINTLRTAASLAPRSAAQLRTAIEQAIDAQS